MPPRDGTCRNFSYVLETRNCAQSAKIITAINSSQKSGVGILKRAMVVSMAKWIVVPTIGETAGFPTKTAGLETSRAFLKRQNENAATLRRNPPTPPADRSLPLIR